MVQKYFCEFNEHFFSISHMNLGSRKDDFLKNELNRFRNTIFEFLAKFHSILIGHMDTFGVGIILLYE